MSSNSYTSGSTDIACLDVFLESLLQSRFPTLLSGSSDFSFIFYTWYCYCSIPLIFYYAISILRYSTYFISLIVISCSSRGMIPGKLYPRLGLLFSLGGLQGLVGWWMVKSGLEMDPAQRKEIRVSPYRLASHLTMAFTTYALLLWTGTFSLIHSITKKLKLFISTPCIYIHINLCPSHIYNYKYK